MKSPEKLSWRVVLILLICAGKALAVAPNAEDIGAILGYPSSELIVEDITSREAETLNTLTPREERAGGLAIRGDKLLAAYRVSVKNPETFSAIIISVAQEGTFTNAKAIAEIQKMSELPDILTNLHPKQYQLHRYHSKEPLSAAATGFGRSSLYRS